MKFLKLFESKYYDEFEKLKQITGVDEIEDDIKDTIQELIDDFNFFRFNNPQTLLQLTYQRKVKRTTSIGLDYYQKIVSQNDRISAAEGSYITGFMDKLTYGESLYFFKVFQFQLLSIDIKASQEDLNTMKNLKESLLIVFKRLEYLGFTPILSYQLGQSNNIINSVNSGKIPIGVNSINTIFNELEALVKSTLEDEDEDEIWNQTGLSCSHYLYIIQKIDFNKPKVNISEVPQHLSTSFEDFIKKHRISREGQEELRQLLKTNMLKESVENKDDFEEVKEIVKDWFDSYTDDITEITTGRLYFLNEGKCPWCWVSCKSDGSPVSLGYDYDHNQVNFQCPDCDYIGTAHDFESELELKMLNYSVWNNNVMNSITVRDLETNNFSLHFLHDKQVEHLNSIIKPLGYSYFEWGTNKRNPNSTITSLENIDNIEKNIESSDSNIQIFYPKRG
jgi:hypothetical protein